LSAKRTGSKVLALLAGSALALTACATSSGGPGATSGAKKAPITITLGYAQEFTAYNSNTVDRSALANTLVLNQVLRGFYYFKPDGTLAPDRDFGSYEKTSDNPLTVKYKINPKAVWSDGEPVDCDDIVLTWLANSTLTGDKGFSSSNPAGYDMMNPPACKEGDKEATVTYRTPFADWEGRFNWTSIMPAHIVEAQGGLTKSIVEYATKPRSPDLIKAIDFYNKGWALSPGQLKKDIMPSSGPYLIDSWTAKESLTLRANPKWWGAPPKAEKIVIRIVADDHQAQALQNGEIDVMEPQPQVDIVNQLKQQGDKVKVQYSYSYSLEHLDFNFKGVFGDKRLREAFAFCVPRQAIVNNLVKPTNPNTEVLQSRFIFPFQPQYSAFVTGVGGQKYNTVDLARAKRLMKAAGRTGVKVRVGWKKLPTSPNKRRADTVALLKSSCGQVGFNVVDAGAPNFFEKELVSGNFDVALYTWTGAPMVADNATIYQTAEGGQGAQNFLGYSNAQVDRLFDELSTTTDKDKQTNLLKQIDTILWSDLATIPLYPVPGIVVTSAKVENVQFNATNYDLTWNAQEWSLKQ
jgi:peptide/nickel transport system substrate-binding protein